MGLRQEACHRVELNHAGACVPGANSTLMAGEPSDTLGHLWERGFRHVYVDGGTAIPGFLAAGLIGRLVINSSTRPDRPRHSLFGPLPHDMNLIHMSARTQAALSRVSIGCVLIALTAMHPWMPVRYADQ
jgi:hypothetical protein